jgi:hypothetical protein
MIRILETNIPLLLHYSALKFTDNIHFNTFRVTSGNNVICEILGSHGGEFKVKSLLECIAV